MSENRQNSFGDARSNWPGPAALRLGLLGGFAAEDRAGRPIAVSARKDRALLAYLALGPGRRHARDKLGGLLWDAEGDGRHNLRQGLVALRRALGRTGALDLGRDDIALKAEAVAVDARRFEALTAEATPSADEAAMALYRGALLEDFPPVAPLFDDWLMVERERLGTLAVVTLGRLLDHHAAQHDVAKAIDTATRLVSLDPFHEEARRTLMLLLAENGQVGAALRHYEGLAALLKREIGVEPEDETRQLYHLLRGRSLPGPRVHRRRSAARPAPIARAGESEAFLRHAVMVLEQMPDCLVVTDVDGKVVGWNSWAARNFGYAKNEVLGGRLGFLYGTANDHTASLRLIANTIRYGRWSGVLRLVAKDGTVRLHKRTILPLRDERGRIAGIFGVSRPLTRPVPGLPRG
jgi:PAS domain S-box-containing protein